MEIEMYTMPSGRQPYAKWYNDNPGQQAAVNQDIKVLETLSFKSDNGLPKSIARIRNQSRTDDSRKTERLYSMKITKEHLIYFGIIDDKIILFTGGHKDDHVRDIAKVRGMYIDYINTKLDTPEVGGGQIF